MAGAGSIATALNLIVTVIAHRCPGMTLRKMPMFVWMVMVTQFLIIWAMPFLTGAAIMILFDRFLGTHFFVGPLSNAILYEHLFWALGHPEVYILIVPAFGMLSEIIPVFSRKPLFGYTFVAMSGVAIGFISFIVWAHHMFTLGLGEAPEAFFAATTAVIAIPTGVKILNWLATMWGGRIHWTASMKFAVAFIPLFVIGGISGVMFAVVPIDYQTQDTYFVVAHFHYVLFGGSMFLILSAIYYWFPKITGRLLDEGLGSWHFWLTLIGFNVTFFPMHLIPGMPRRVYTYASDSGWGTVNMIATIEPLSCWRRSLSSPGTFTSVCARVRSPGLTRGMPSPWSGRPPRRRPNTTLPKSQRFAAGGRSGMSSTPRCPTGFTRTT